MNPFAHTNHRAERAFWLGPRALESNSNNATVEAPPGVRPAVASRPEHSELPSDGPAGDFVHPCQREL